MIKINDWKVIRRGDVYGPLENWITCLTGKIAGHPNVNVADGRVITSEIISADGRVIKTASGSVYLLGKINPEYRKWLKENYNGWDWRNPIKTIRKDNK